MAALQARVRRLLGSRAEMEASRALLSTLVAAGDGESGGGVGLELSPASASAGGGGTLAELRRSLRASLENKQLALAESALVGLGETLARLEALRAQVDVLDDKCTRVQRFLETTKRETQQVKTEAAALAHKTEQVQGELDAARAFLGRYQLSEDEVAALYARPDDTERREEVGGGDMERLFAALERVRQVKADCKALVAAGDVSCALELLDAVGRHQEVGFERLYQWTAAKCAQMDEREPSSYLHRAIALLRDRPEFYNYCKESLTGARRSLNVRRFILALTRGGPNGIPRPIEMHAHDPVRYCGDMLAWVHQAIATDSEFFRVLFDGDMELVTPANTEVQGEASGGQEANHTSASMVGRAFDGVARPLAVRVEQTLAAPHGLVIAYKLVHLLAFYAHTFDALVPGSPLAHALGECRAAANRAFQHELRLLVDSIEASAAASPAGYDYSVVTAATSLGATHATLDVAQRLSALLEVAQSSPLPESDKHADLAPLLDAVLAAVLRVCEQQFPSRAVGESGVMNADALVFRINNVSCLLAALARFDTETRAWRERMQRDVDTWLRDLSERQAQQVLERCGVAPLLRRIQAFLSDELAHETSAAAAPGLDGATVSRTLAAFCAAAEALAFPLEDQLSQPALGDRARQLTARALAAAYEFVVAFVHDERRGYVVAVEADAAAPDVVALRHSAEQMRTVLELDTVP